MKQNLDDLEHYAVYKSHSDKYCSLKRSLAIRRGTDACCEHRDSVDAFIHRHNVQGAVNSTDDVRKLKRDTQPNYTDTNKSDNVRSCDNKITRSLETEMFVSKIIKYNRRLNQVIMKLMKALSNEREQSDLIHVINLLRDKHRQNVLYLAKESFKKLVKFDDFIDDNLSTEVQWESSAGVNFATNDHKNVKSENMIGNRTGESTAHDICGDKVIHRSRSPWRDTIDLHGDQGHTNLYSTMNSKSIMKMNNENLTLYPQIIISSNKRNIIPKNSLSKTDSKLPKKDGNNINHTKAQKKPLSGRVEILDRMKEKSNTDTSSDIVTKIDDLVKSVNLLIEEMQRKKKNAKEIKTDYITESKQRFSNVINYLKTDSINVVRKQNAAVNTDISIVCAKLMTGPRYGVVNLKNKCKHNVMGIKSDNKNNTQRKILVKETSSKGITTGITTCEKAVTANNSYPLWERSTLENTITEEKPATKNETKITTTAKQTNTDPLGVVALLRVSAESIRQLLSYVPSIDYYSYLPFLQSTNYLEEGELQYVCDICGAAFSKASVLNDHIKSHDLGFASNCSVCQHVLRSDRVRAEELFKCRFCGQRFTRAYCCELHQQSCAKRLGVHESTSSLILLG